MLPIHHLSKDKKLAQLIQRQAAYQLTKRKNICLQLCFSIMSQQLSTRVARTFHTRFIQLFDNPSPSPSAISAISFEKLRSIGLSNAKSQYIQHVASFFTQHHITDSLLYNMEDDEIISLLTQIKGVGRWTAEMVLMFSLAREDVFSIDDLGIRQTICSLYHIDTTDKKKMNERIIRISNKWSPYRTYACLYLWGWKDNSNV